MIEFDTLILNRWTFFPGDVRQIPIKKLDMPRKQARFYEISLKGRKYILKIHPINCLNKIKKNAIVSEKVNKSGINTLMGLTTANGKYFVATSDSLYEMFELNSLYLDDAYSFLDNLEKAEVIASIMVKMSYIGEFAMAWLEPVDLLAGAFKQQLIAQCEAHNCLPQIKQIISYLDKNMEPYLPYLDTKFAHGDFHPGNIMADKYGYPLIADWEYARIAEELYDLAFLTGCIGFVNPEYLKSVWVGALLDYYSRGVRATRLSHETFFDLLVTIRLYWLYQWISYGNLDLIDLEIAYLEYLINNKYEIKAFFNSVFAYRALPGIDDWIITDETMPPEANDLKELILAKDIRTYGDLTSMSGLPEEKSAELLKYVVIALGKDKNILKIIDVLHMAEEKISNHIALVYVYANVALELLKHGQIRAMEKLLAAIGALSAKFSGQKDVKIAYAYVLRNYSVLLGEKGGKIKDTIDLLSVYSMANSTVLEITEEYARALANAVVTARKNKDQAQATAYNEELLRLNAQSPTAKISSACKIAARALEK